jgi:hypothetical protein
VLALAEEIVFSVSSIACWASLLAGWGHVTVIEDGGRLCFVIGLVVFLRVNTHSNYSYYPLAVLPALFLSLHIPRGHSRILYQHF